MNAAELQREALRQQMLVRALWRDARAAVVGGWLRGDERRWRRGLAAYQANAGALAERALAAAYPTVQQLVGEESFGQLARALWQAHAPERGDIGEWGAALPAFMAAAPQLAEEPYLADVARLDWAVHAAERAIDDDAAPSGLDLLASADPDALRLVLRSGSTYLESPHPVVTIWQAHRSDDDGRFAPVRAAFAAGTGEAALVVRQGLRAEVGSVPPAERAFTAALFAGTPLGGALRAADPAFDFEAWLVQTLRAGRLAAVRPHSAEELP
jgi:hypothetical protein